MFSRGTSIDEEKKLHRLVVCPTSRCVPSHEYVDPDSPDNSLRTHDAKNIYIICYYSLSAGTIINTETTTIIMWFGYSATYGMLLSLQH